MALLLAFLTLVIGYMVQLCDDFSSVAFTYLIPFFSRIAWIYKLHDFMKRFFLNKGCHRNRTIVKSENASSKKRILYIYTINEKIEFTGYALGEIKSRNLKNVHFKKNPKVKKHISFTFHDYLPQFSSENKDWLS